MRKERKIKRLTRENIQPAEETNRILDNKKVYREADVIPRKETDASFYMGVNFESERR